MVPNPLTAANATAAAIFRAIEIMKLVTMLFDEGETFFDKYPEFRGIINSGHTRATAFVIRATGIYSTWAPKAYAIIGSPPETIRDRSILLRLQRKLPREKTDRLRYDEVLALGLREQAARWAAENMDRLSEVDPAMPKDLNDRQLDSWTPLVAIADLLGGDWPELARKAAVAISKESNDDDTSAEDLLADVAKLFQEAKTDRLPSATLVRQLVVMPDRPWATFVHGTPLKEVNLANLLRRFGAGPKQWGEGPKAYRRSVRGYYLSELAPIFARYVPAVPGSEGAAGTPATPEAGSSRTDSDEKAQPDTTGRPTTTNKPTTSPPTARRKG